MGVMHGNSSKACALHVASRKQEKITQTVKFVYPKDSVRQGQTVAFSFQKLTSKESANYSSEEHLTPSLICDYKTSTASTSNSTKEALGSVDEIFLGKKKAKLDGSRRKSEDIYQTNRDVRGSSPSKRAKSKHDTPAKLSGISVEDALRDETGCRPRANSTDAELNLPRRGLCDEGMVLESHRWSRKWRQKAPKGFVNLGNTCFLNATLQCLAYIPPFCQCLTSLASPSGKVSQGQRITELLRRLFREVHDLDSCDSAASLGGALAPRQVVKAVPVLGTIGNRNGYKFRPGRQEDAHEFLVHLLDAMHDGELKSAGIDQHKQGWRDQLPIARIDETTLIHRIFGGYLRSQVRCTKCGYCSNTYDPFMDLALEVCKKSCSSVESAFQEFTRKETLDSKNRWKCSGCLKNVCATKQLTVFRPPLSLCVQLKRFSFSQGFGFGHFSKGMKLTGTGGGAKISKAIEFPARLKLSLSDGRKCEYVLTGVVVHLGGSATSGHYTAFVRKPHPAGNSKWYHMDDSYVEPVSEKTVLRQKHAYVLFYCRTEVRLELPPPPLRSSMTAKEAKELSMARSRARSLSFTSEGPPQKAARESQHKTNWPSTNESVIATPSLLKKIEFQEKEKRVLVRKGGDNADTQETVNGPKSSGKQRKTEASTEADVDESASSAPSVKIVSQKRPTEEGVVPAAQSSSSIFSPVISKTHTEGPIKPIPSVESMKPKSTKKTRVVLDCASGLGKLEVMIGPRYRKKAWKSKATVPRSSDVTLDLLGTRAISKWHEDDVMQSDAGSRRNAVKGMENEEKTRKRSTYSDRWDSLLDQGRKKKIRTKEPNAAVPSDAADLNPFHRIQSGIQRMNRGRAKGQKYGRHTPEQKGKAKPNLKKRKRT